jgi:hypothetical protein
MPQAQEQLRFGRRPVLKPLAAEIFLFMPLQLHLLLKALGKYVHGSDISFYGEWA